MGELRTECPLFSAATAGRYSIQNFNSGVDFHYEMVGLRAHIK